MASRTPPSHAGILAAYGAAAARPKSAADALARARDDVAGALGEQGLVDAACVASFFAGISRIVDATGLPDEPPEQYVMMEFVFKRALPGVALLGVAATVFALGVRA